MEIHEQYMRRCIELAWRGGKNVKTNPMVGSVLVYRGKVIGEGYHAKFGGPHGERSAIDDAIRQDHQNLIADASLYITLEPCSFHGKTPPCKDYILENKIKHVVIGVEDPNPKVAGSSIKFLKAHGVNVETGILAEACQELIRSFEVHLQKRPYVILKWAQSKDGFLGVPNKQVWLSNEYSKKLVHKWRTEVDGLMVGTQTAIIDNPKLTTRLWTGSNPTRITIDHEMKIPPSHHIFNEEAQSIILSSSSSSNLPKHVQHIKTEGNKIEVYFKHLFEAGIYILMIEGGAQLLKSAIKSGLWDEARIIKTEKILEEGLKAPSVEGKLAQSWDFQGDYILKILNMKR